ncbi:glycosyltransferase family 2 protein [Alteromonas sp. 1_MG-2023]|uniref:glycosyltransferase n=1 Tax=Alteromonas sp. 1_MG-2023 TaxID=3062669 RepID=UPI0026E280F2|nr:glycosyltransferase family 2 protein [Alteromonas sp. 1_MG-2023]MDO6566316.1 glycosyltransferase family 2 protein [Alteromonas sp. 1_MG-2023]
MSILTSFIIPHKGREAMLIDTINSIANQTVSRDSYEVIVVSQNTSASQVLSALGETLNLSIIYNAESKTISHSRNLGAEHAKGSFLAFLDADVALSPNWLETVKAKLESDAATALVSTMQINSNNAPPLERIRTALSNADLDTEVSFLPGRNLFLAKHTFYEAGQFPEHLLTCEDYYFTDKVNQIGTLYYTSKAHYVHLGEDKAFIPMWKKEIWRGQSNLASLKGRDIPLREFPSFIVPFAVTGGVMLFFLALILSQTEIATLFALGTLIPLLAYTARLKKLTGKQVSVGYCLLFYSLYFPARAIGTLLGVRGTVDTSSHR